VQNHLTIQQFSKLCEISTKLLRYYDQRKILQPDLRDENTGYRYYRPGQVAQAKQIVYLREAGLGLEDIRALQRIESGGRTRGARALLRRYEEQLERRRNSLMLAGQYLKSLRVTATGAAARVRLLQMPTMRAAVRRYAGVHSEAVDAIWSFSEELSNAGYKIAGDAVLTWQPERRSPGSTTASTIAIPVLGKKKKLPGVSQGLIEGGTLAAISAKGGTKGLGDSYERLFSWCYEAGFVVSGPMRESYPLEELTALVETGRTNEKFRGNRKTDRAARKRSARSATISVLAPVEPAPATVGRAPGFGAKTGTY
jgi:DNA-binding transcriptional MerR regulator